MILKLYLAFKAWPVGLQNGCVRLGHAFFYSALTLLAQHYYFENSWGASIGAVVIVILASQSGISQKPFRDQTERSIDTDET